LTAGNPVPLQAGHLCSIGFADGILVDLSQFPDGPSEKSGTQIEAVCQHEQPDQKSGAAKQSKLLEKLAVR
jgi:hypothetical protein